MTEDELKTKIGQVFNDAAADNTHAVKGALWHRLDKLVASLQGDKVAIERVRALLRMCKDEALLSNRTIIETTLLALIREAGLCELSTPGEEAAEEVAREE